MHSESIYFGKWVLADSVLKKLLATTTNVGTPQIGKKDYILHEMLLVYIVISYSVSHNLEILC